MKPVDQASLDDILEKKSILMLNQADLEASYIESLVTRNPSNVKSKHGIPLPLEMWLEIIKFARAEPVYCLVQPQSIRQGDQGPELICLEIQEREICCDIESGQGIWVYESYLAAPDEQVRSSRKREELSRPFQLPKTDGQTEPFVVSLSPQNCQLGSLFHNVKVPDIIARLENQNDCGACDGRTLIHAETYKGHEITMDFVGYYTWAWGDALCPLCVGVDECSRCMDRNQALEDHYGQHGSPPDDSDEEDPDDREFKEEYGTNKEHWAWVNSRLKELGYRFTIGSY